jgi:D-3-phosphoglycerate dehydrogenase
MKILICDPVDESIPEHFREEGHDVLETFDESSLNDELEGAHFMVVRSGTTVDENLLSRANDLIGIVRAGVGLDNIDLEAAEDHGVNVENTPEASTNAVAELVVGHILSVYRSISRADRALKNGDWIKSDIDGREIQGKTVGIIGFGRIGRRIGDILSTFGADIQAFDEYIDDDTIREGGGTPTSFDELIQTSDIVTVHVPLTPETRGLIGTEEIKRAPDNAVFINCARGGVIDEDALLEGLESGEIMGAGLDTYETEPPGKSDLVTHPAVVTTPHIGASTGEAQARIGDLVIEKIEAMI